MKKITLLLFTIATVSTQGSAQQPKSTSGMATSMKPSIGFDVGLNLSKFNVASKDFANPSLAPTTKNKPSFHAGAFLDIPIGGIFSLKPQVIYSRQGSKVTQTTMSGTGSTSTNYDEDLNYLYVAPAAIHILTPGGFIAESGPMLGFLLNAKQEGPSPYNNNNIKNRRNNLDFLWTAGIGYLTPVGVGLHLRYNYGFSNVLNAKDNSLQSNGKMQNRLIQIGLMFHLHGHGSHGGHDAR